MQISGVIAMFLISWVRISIYTHFYLIASRRTEGSVDEILEHKEVGLADMQRFG
jgi:hypothetical protein